MKKKDTKIVHSKVFHVNINESTNIQEIIDKNKDEFHKQLEELMSNESDYFSFYRTDVEYIYVNNNQLRFKLLIYDGLHDLK